MTYRAATILCRVVAILCAARSGAVHLYATLPSPRTHALYSRHAVKPPELTLYSPRASPDSFVPGFACCRGFNMVAPVTDWVAILDQYTNASDAGGYGPQGLASLVWPGAGDALAGNWPVLAELLASRRLPVTDMAGFVPGGMHSTVKNSQSVIL